MLEKICLVGVFCTGRTQEVFLFLAFVIAKRWKYKKRIWGKKIYTHIINVFVCVYINTSIYIILWNKMEVWKSVSTWELLQRIYTSFFTLLFNQLVRNHCWLLLFFFLHKITSPELIFQVFFQAMYLVHLLHSSSPEGVWDRDGAIWPLMSRREKLWLNFFWCFNTSFLPPFLAWTSGCLEEVWRQHPLN